MMQPDLAGGSPASPQSLNRYSYSVNSPIDLADPTGLDAVNPYATTPPTDPDVIVLESVHPGELPDDTIKLYSEPLTEDVGVSFSAADLLTAFINGVGFLTGMAVAGGSDFVPIKTAGKWIRKRYSRCRQQAFGNESWYNGKSIPGEEQSEMILVAGQDNSDYTAMVASIWAKESNFTVDPGGDAGPAQLTGWWRRNEPQLIVGDAYGSWHGRTDPTKNTFDGSPLDNVKTLGNIVAFLAQDRGVNKSGNWGDLPKGYGPGAAGGDPGGGAYSADVMSRFAKYKQFFDCLLGN